jgi:hypothetical protein
MLPERAFLLLTDDLLGARHLACGRAGTITIALALASTAASRARAPGCTRRHRRARPNAAGFGAGLACSGAPAVAANAVDTEAERTLAIVRTLGTRGQSRGAARSGGSIQLGARTAHATRAGWRNIHRRCASGTRIRAAGATCTTRAGWRNIHRRCASRTRTRAAGATCTTRASERSIHHRCTSRADRATYATRTTCTYDVGIRCRRASGCVGTARSRAASAASAARTARTARAAQACVGRLGVVRVSAKGTIAQIATFAIERSCDAPASG